MNIETIRSMKNNYVEQLISLKNVISVGVGKKRVEDELTDEMGIIVGVTQKLPQTSILLEKSDVIPKKINEIKTDVVQVGEIRSLTTIPYVSTLVSVLDRRNRIRPARGGYSIGNIRITAGTFGCVVYRNNEPFILSNAHVLTPDATVSPPEARKILQPGPYDGGTDPNDLIGYLEDYIVILPSIDLSTCNVSQGTAKVLNAITKVFGRQSRFYVFAQTQAENLVDAAIAKPINSDDIDPDVQDIGIPSGSFTGSLVGTDVVKSGRTTGTTNGTIQQIDVDVNVSYGSMSGIPTKIARFKDQILIESTDRFSQGGDSGSTIFVDDGQRKVCGLLFAGNQEGTATYANNIQNVLQLLNISLTP
jgi:hypothetical protein